MPENTENLTPRNEISSQSESEKELYKRINWEGGLELLDANWPDEYLKAREDWDKMEYWLELAAAMHEFDPERFHKDVIITDSTCDIFYQKVNNIIKELHSFENPADPDYHRKMLTLLFISAPLKELEPKRFEREINMDDELWGKIADWIDDTYGNCYGPLSIDLYEMAYTVNPQKIAELLPIDQSNWPRIQREVKVSPVRMTLALKAQNIKPEGLPDIEVSQQEWMEWQEIMGNWFANQRCDSLVFKSAKALRDKKVKVVS